jgi:hypothetical protein
VDEIYACKAVVVVGIVNGDDDDDEDDRDEDGGVRVLAWSCGDDEGGEGVGE